MTTYSVKLISPTGNSYLSVKGRASWKTKRIAKEYVRQIQVLINKGRNIYNATAVECVNEFGETV